MEDCAGRQRPPVHVFVRTRDDRRPLGDLIRGLAASTYPAHRLFLAVQAAQDTSVARLREQMQGVAFHWDVIPGGFRQALERCADGYWLVLGPGVSLRPGTIDRLVDALQREPDAGAAEARPAEQARDHDCFSGETSWCSRSCTLYRPAAIWASGGPFDEGLCEAAGDIELSWRLWLHGWKCLHVREAGVEMAETAGDPFAELRDGALLRVTFGSTAQALLHYGALLWRSLGRGGTQALAALVASLGRLPEALRKRSGVRRLTPNRWVTFNGWNCGPPRRDLPGSLRPLGREDRLPAPAEARRPGLSVVIPTHNRGGTVGQVLRRLLEQDFPAGDYEVVVVDSRSSDDTAAVLARLRACNLRVLRTETPGAAAARNLGLDAARGDLVVLMDDDVLVRHDFLRRFAQAHEETPRQVLLAHILNPWRDSVNPFHRYLQNAAEITRYEFPDDDDVPADYFYTGCVAIPRATLGETRFDERFQFYGLEDIEFGGRLLGKGVRMRFLRSLEVLHEYYPEFRTFRGKMQGAGRSLGYFLDKQPARAEQYPFGKWYWKFHRVVGLALGAAWPLAALAELLERVRYASGPVNRVLYCWYRANIRLAMYRGLLEYQAARREEDDPASLAAVPLPCRPFPEAKRRAA